MTLYQDDSKASAISQGVIRRRIAANPASAEVHTFFFRWMGWNTHHGHILGVAARAFSRSRSAASGTSVAHMEFMPGNTICCSSEKLFRSGKTICFSSVDATPVSDCQHHQIHPARRNKSGREGETPEPTLM